ncbi:RNA-processing protein [Candidatus Woesearchaeota archaeon]|nr:RNA-processing protein [Candidatus Woesearchaeota archaeon]
MADFMNQIKIPQDRIAVLIGKDGETKDEVENRTGCKLDIDSKEGDVSINGVDPLMMFTCAEIVKAIGRGFNPDIALLLTKIDYVLEIISIAEYAKTQNDMIRIRGRVIGKEGKSRKVIEDLLEVYIVVYGKTVSVIGRGDSVALARRALENLLSGSTHANVYKWLEKQRKLYKQREIEGDDDLKE